MKVTINDVAKKAGVSIKTVSRVTNNEMSVRAATREKVLAVIAELNYQPNLAARNLAGSKSYAIGFIYDNPNAYYVIDMQNGILAACKKQGYELLIHPCNAKSEHIIDELKAMIKHSRLAGLVLTPPFSESEQIVNELRQLDIQLVRIISGAGDHNPDPCCIYINDYYASEQITEHLLALGHRDIAFLSGGVDHQSTDERRAGYESMMKQHGIEINPDYIVPGEYSFESGVEGAKKLLALPSPPTAIFACNDEIAAGALFAARLNHIAIPEQLSIVGFEDSPFSRQTWPKLTTAHQPNMKIAEYATEVLVKQIRIANGQEKSNMAVTGRHCFNPELVVRDSTGACQG